MSPGPFRSLVVQHTPVNAARARTASLRVSGAGVPEGKEPNAADPGWPRPVRREGAAPSAARRWTVCPRYPPAFPSAVSLLALSYFLPYQSQRLHNGCNSATAKAVSPTIASTSNLGGLYCRSNQTSTENDCTWYRTYALNPNLTRTPRRHGPFGTTGDSERELWD